MRIGNHFPELPDRQKILERLLPVDLEYAEKSGLVDMFYYDPKTGEDGLMHTLGGNLTIGESGAAIAEGFHHAPSAEFMWPREFDASGAERPTTYIDTAHLEGVNSKKREPYKHYPLEPFKAQVTINGLAKLSRHTAPKTGEKKFVRAKNSMFPDEYDALAVMQAVRQAKDDPGRTERMSRDDRGRDVIVVDGKSMLMDGKTKMIVRMTLDPITHKVMTAMPIVGQHPGLMKLTPEQAVAVPFSRESYHTKNEQ